MVDIGEYLGRRKSEGLLRSLNPGLRGVDFSSNDYLGLSGHPRLLEGAKKAIEKFGTSSTGSRLMSGDSFLFHELEEKVARFKCKESALVFNSGYQANAGIVSSLIQKGDCVFSDRLNHASIIDGIMLSGAKIFRFRHNDADHLETLLKTERGKYKDALIVTETIFSMDGDRPPLRRMVDLKEKYDCLLMVDEAHATGIFGASGGGIVEEEGLQDRVDFVMGTFSKGLGSFGAYIAASREIIDYLVNRARSFIYSTALPPGVIGANLAALDIVREEPERRRSLLANALYFRERLGIKGESQIVPVVIGDQYMTVEAAKRLLEKGFRVVPVRPPTVPPGQSRLRISLTYNHTKDILDRLVDELLEIRI